MNSLLIFVSFALCINVVLGDFLILLRELNHQLDHRPLDEPQIENLLFKIDRVVQTEHWPVKGEHLRVVAQLKTRFALRKAEQNSISASSTVTISTLTTQFSSTDESRVVFEDLDTIITDQPVSVTTAGIINTTVLTDFAAITSTYNTTNQNKIVTTPSGASVNGDCAEAITTDHSHYLVYSVMLLALCVCNLTWLFFYRRLKETIREVEGRTYAHFDTNASAVLIGRRSTLNSTGVETTTL